FLHLSSPFIVDNCSHISNLSFAITYINLLENIFSLRACLKKAFCKMCVTICGRFCPIEGGVVGYANRKRAEYTAKWGVQIAGMIFQTGS
ncbi:hypothetical protein PNY53_19245, partial [Ruminococcus sp. 1001136sp1]